MNNDQNVDGRTDLRAGDSPMTVTEVAEYLNVHPSTIYRLLKTDVQLGQFKIGSLWRFGREDIMRFARGESAQQLKALAQYAA